MIHAPERLNYTGDADADRLLARDPLALLIGFTLDQQVTVQKAFGGPLELERRLGRSLDAAHIAAMDPEELAAIFRERPALHRFPGAMAARVQALCAAVTATYGGDAARLWMEAADGRDLRGRLLRLPGVGEMKAGTIVAVLARRFRLQLPGIEAVVPGHPTLGDVDSLEALARYQAGKRAHKAALRAGKDEAEAGRAAMRAAGTTAG
jgi:uncharacterized HhH-GPD family protein